ncbi:MAG: hypothetical protein ACE3JQ_01080 [Paenisporosarcina sp.]
MTREIFQIYNRNLYSIIFLSITIIFPITALIFTAILYLNEINGLTSQTYIAGLLLLINFILCAPPYLKLVLLDLQDEKMGWREGFQFFIKQFGPLFITSVALYLTALYTMWLFLIPSILILMYLLIIPYYSDVNSYKSMMKLAGSKLIDENISVLIDLVIVISVSLLVWSGMMYLMQNFQNNLYGYMLIRVILNIFTLPFIYIYLSLRYRSDQFSV